MLPQHAGADKHRDEARDEQGVLVGGGGGGGSAAGGSGNGEAYAGVPSDGDEEPDLNAKTEDQRQLEVPALQKKINRAAETLHAECLNRVEDEAKGGRAERCRPNGSNPMSKGLTHALSITES